MKDVINLEKTYSESKVMMAQWHLVEHNAAVTAVTFSRDGDIVASGDVLGKIIFWHTEEHRYLDSLDTGEPNIRCLSYAPGNGKILSGMRSGNIRICSEHDPVRVLKAHSDVVYAASYSPDGSMIVSCSRDSTVKLWDAESLTCNYEFRMPNCVNCVAFSPDGERILACDMSGNFVAVDAKTHKCIKRFGPYADRGNSIAYSPDGKYIAIGCNFLQALVLDARTYKVVKELKIPSIFNTVSYSPDGRYLAIAGEHYDIIVVDTRTWSCAHILTNRDDGCLTEHASHIAFSPKYNILAGGSQEQVVDLWYLDDKALEFKPTRSIYD